MSEINMRQIETFLAVAKYQNISKASQELYTSQPAVSNWIVKMEESCGFQLFRRTNRGVTLTPEGEELYARLDIAYHRFRVSVEEICNSHRNDRQTLRIGILNRQAAQDTANGLIRAFGQARPDVPVVGERYNFHELRDKILCEELDLIFSISADIWPYPEFDSLPICDYPAFFILSRAWERSLLPGEGLSGLSGRSLIIEAPTQRPWAEQICADAGIVPSEVRFVNSYILLNVLVAREQGFSIDGRMISDRIPPCEAVFCPVPQAHSAKVVMAWRKEKLSPLAGQFLDFVSADITGQ